MCNYRGSNQTDRGMSGKTCARLFDPFGTGSIKEPDAWWFDYKSLTPQDFFTAACVGWFDRSAARSGVYRLTTNEEYSRYRIASLYLRGKFTGCAPQPSRTSSCRPISILGNPPIPIHRDVRLFHRDGHHPRRRFVYHFTLSKTFSAYTSP